MPKGNDLYSEGDRIGERFLVLEKIGSGGFGEVFKVQDEDESILACKVLYPKVVPAYIKLEKIKKTLLDPVPEVPGLVRPKEILELDGNRIVVSDFIPGINLRQYFKSAAENKQLPDALALGAIVDKVLSVLMTFPTLSIHGLVKPSNIILRGADTDSEVPENAVAFLTDFGASRLVSFSKFASIQLGRGNDYYYLAPEYISQGGRVTRAADIYAVGVMLYEGLTGQVPKKDFPRLAEAVPNINTAFDEMVHKALSRSPEKRFQEFGAMRDDLREALPDLPETQMPSESGDEVPETIETEDIFLMDEEGERLADDIEEVDVFGDMPAAEISESEAVVDIPDAQPVEVEQEVDLFGADAGEEVEVEAEPVGDDEGLPEIEPDEEPSPEPFEESQPELGVEPEEEPEEAVDVFGIDEVEPEDELGEPETEPDAESIEVEPEDADVPVEEEIEEVEPEPEIESEAEPHEELEEEPEPEEEPEEEVEEAPVAEEPGKEKPEPPKPAEPKGLSIGTILVIGLFVLMAGLVIWKYVTSQPKTMPVKLQPKLMTPVLAPKPAATPEAEKTVTPTPEPVAETKEEKISKLLKNGKTQLQKKQYLEPSGDNLLTTVQALEKLDPKNAFIKKAKKRMLFQFIAQTKKEMAKKNWDAAEAAAKDGLKVYPKEIELTNYLDMIAKAKAKEAKVKEEKAKEEKAKEEKAKEEKVAEEEKVKEEEKVAEEKAEVPTTCNKNMILIGGGTLRMGSSPDDPMRQPAERTLDPVYVQSFCVDRYEFPNNPGASPKIKVSWYEAKAACESQGKRLCKEREWERSCKGPKNNRYPYGNEFGGTICNTAKEDGSKGSLSSTGAFKECKSPFGVYDLSGNVREWTASRIAPGNPAYVVKGGSAYKSEKSTRCAVREFAMPGETSSLIGFRCCSDVKPK